MKCSFANVAKKQKFFFKELERESTARAVGLHVPIICKNRIFEMYIILMSVEMKEKEAVCRTITIISIEKSKYFY